MGSLIKPIELAANVQAFYLGKPSPLIMRSAMAKLGAKRTDTVIIGDRLDTGRLFIRFLGFFMTHSVFWSL